MPIGAIIAGVGAAINAIGNIKAGSDAKKIGEVNARNEEYISELNAYMAEQVGDENAALLDFNAQMYAALAVDATRRGNQDVEQLQVEGRQLVGSNRASYAAQGIDVNVGSPVHIEEDVKTNIRLDAAQIRTNAAREAWGLDIQSETEKRRAYALRRTTALEANNIRQTGRAQAQSYRLGGSAAARAGNFSAAATIVGAGANIYSMVKK